MAIVVGRRTRASSRDGAQTFEAFYSAGFPVVYRAAYAFSASTEVATEATQEAFVRAYARWGRLHDKHWAMGWVMTTSLNLARKHGRSSRLPRPDRAPATDDQARAAERVDLVAALSCLPPRQKQAAVLHYVGGYEVAEVARLMDLSPGTVKSHLFKARSALRKSMTDPGRTT